MTAEIQTMIRTSLKNPTSSSTAALLEALFEKQASLTQTTQAVFSDTVTVATSDQLLSLPTSSKFTAALQGILCVINLDATNYVDIGPNNGGAMLAMGRLYPLIPMQIAIAPSVVLRWQANTAACIVSFVWFAK